MARANSGSGKSRSKSRNSSSKSGTSGANRNRRSSSNGKGSGKDVPDYSVVDPQEIEEAVDVFLDVPVVKVDEIKFEMDDFRAHLALLAEAGHFVQLNAGAAVRLGKVELDIQNVEAQAMLEVRLEHVTKILGRVLTTLDRNPKLLKSVGDALGDVGGGAHDLLTDTGAESALGDVGQGAGRGVAGIGRGAGQGVEGLGEGTQQGVEGLGQGTQQGVQGVGQGAQEGLQQVTQQAQRGDG
jgi:hypothetical protein